uniref:Glutamyl-tRNA(Gln) amidotransferase subunit A, mitochondrial n=1 Tax=Syphacia muris TaxID=451379 RepID=A0A0N5AYD7_9BILA
MQKIEAAIEKAIKFRKYNALITETFDLAIQQAYTALQHGLQPFPIVVKDCYTFRNVRTTCGSKMLENYISPYSATVVKRLTESGGCIIGKANMDEFCMGTSSSSSYFGPVKNGFSEFNRLDNDWLIPGGSSGGSAVSVQLGFADVALGSDTGGSSRNPAAFTGTFGFKPSYGVLSRHGLIPLVNSLDCPALITKNARECNFYFKNLVGKDSNDAASINAPSSCFIQNRELSNITIGIPEEFFNDSLSQSSWNAWNDAAKALAKLGCKVKKVSMPHIEYSIICYHVIAETDISSNMARYDGVAYGHRSKNTFSTHEMYASGRSEALGEVVRRRILAGNFFLLKRYFAHVNKYFTRALKVRRLIKQDFDRVFREQNCSALLTPVTIGTPPLASQMKEGNYERERSEDFYTQPANMAGIPACSVPFVKTEDGLSIAVQIMSDHLQDGIVLQIADQLEKYSYS